MSNIIKRVWNQNRMVNIEALSGMAFQVEDGGHTFEISGINDAEEAVELSGTVAGVFMRPDGADVALTGTASDGVVSVTLSDACYAVAGRFGLTIFVTADSKKTCVYACIGTVTQTSYGTVAGDTPQDVVDLINAINTAIAGIPADYTQIMAAIAPTYSNTATYPKNAYAWYDGVLYRALIDITTAESWTAAHWEAAPLSDALKLFYENIGTTRNLNTLSVGKYQSIHGAPVATTSANYFGLSTYLPVSANTKYTATFYNITPAIGSIRASYYASDKTYLSENLAWSVSKLTFTTPSNCAYVHVWIYISGGITTSSDSHIQVELGGTSTPYVPPYSVIDVIARDGVANENTEITGLKSVDAALKDTQTQLLFNYIREKPFSHHIGVSQTSNIIIPAQSLFDIQRAKRLGFQIMELNVLETSDGKWICDHGFSGKWGAQFYSTDSTDISDTLVSSMTLAEIKSKVRYNSIYPKYRVSPPTLEEALRECKRVGIVPLIQYKEGIIELADSVMGKGNYIANLYTMDRGTITDGMVSSWLAIADKDDLVAKCDASGGAYIAVLNVSDSAYSSFTLSDWEDMADALHAKGYLIGSAYTPQMLLPTLMKAGFDLFLSSCNTNRIENGNLCNLYGDSEFSDFATTGTVADNAITLTANQTITPAETMPTVFLGKGHLTIRFSGTIYVYLSKYFNNAYSFTSDGSDTLDISSFFEEEQATFTVRAAASTTVYEIIYKASEV